ncbi:MAG: beta-N-acetylhexosaminidase [Lachnospiraceae bacterium]|nr:beta-N-acetylhexosaminidase [Lachnospiraceae bacterium]
MEQNAQERREARRRRRQRNQIIAYIVVILLIILFAIGVVKGVNYVTELGRQKEQIKQEQQDKVDDMFEEEEVITTPEPTAEPTPPVIELTPEQKLDEIVNAGIEVMPLEDKVAGLFIVTPESITGVGKAIKAGDGTKEALSKYSVGGIVYFGQNIRSEEQFKEMISNTLLFSNYPLFIALDEEGGSVSRLAGTGLVDKVDSANKIAQSGDANSAYQAGSVIGTYLNEYGVNLDFAPVADLANVDNSVIGDRSFGADATVVSAYVNAMMQGLQDNKVTACLKHFPGIGSSTQDTHKGLATTDRTAEEFRANEFVVFKAGIDAGADMIMVNHMSAPSLDASGEPCSLSEAVVTGILRNELGFDGVIITDALNMKAIADYKAADEAAVMALKAGCDMLLMPEDFEKAYEGVLKAVRDGVISEERIDDALRRIYRIKYADKVPE